MLYESQEAVIRLFNDYSSIASEAKYKAKQWKGLKISLTQVKAGNTSENLLNEIKQIMYSLYREKK